MIAALGTRVPIQMRIAGKTADQARTVAAIPTSTAGLYVAWSSERRSYQIVHTSGLAIAHGWDRAEDDLVAHAVDWTSSPFEIRKATYQAIHDVAAAIWQHGGTFIHTLNA